MEGAGDSKALDPGNTSINVRIQLPNNTKILRPGMFARASFVSMLQNDLSFRRERFFLCKGNPMSLPQKIGKLYATLKFIPVLRQVDTYSL